MSAMLNRYTGDMHRPLVILALGLALAACATPDDIRQEKYVYREETLPMTLDETERYVHWLTVECRPHYILKLVQRDPDHPGRLTAVVKDTRVSAVVDFEEVTPGLTRVRTYAPFQIFKSSGVRSMYELLLNPCPGRDGSGSGPGL